MAWWASRSSCPDRRRRLGGGARLARAGRAGLGTLDGGGHPGGHLHPQPPLRGAVRGPLPLGRHRSAVALAALVPPRPRRRATGSERVVRVLCLTNMWPGPEDPDYGSFVADMCAALERRGLEVDPVVIDRRAHGAARTPRSTGRSPPGRPGTPGARRHLRPLPLPDGRGGGARGTLRTDPLRRHGPRPGRAEPRPAVRPAGDRGARCGASAVIAVSRYLADGLRATGLDLPPVHVVHMGVDLARFHPGDRAPPGPACGSRPTGRSSWPWAASPTARTRSGCCRPSRACGPSARGAAGLRGGRPPRSCDRRGGRGASISAVGHPRRRAPARPGRRVGGRVRPAGHREPRRAARRGGPRGPRGGRPVIATRVGGTREVVPDRGRGGWWTRPTPRRSPARSWPCSPILPRRGSAGAPPSPTASTGRPAASRRSWSAPSSERSEVRGFPSSERWRAMRQGLGDKGVGRAS